MKQSDFFCKKIIRFKFLRCGNSLKKRCRKYRAQLAILKSIQADFALFFVFIFFAAVAIAVGIFVATHTKETKMLRLHIKADEPSI